MSARVGTSSDVLEAKLTTAEAAAGAIESGETLYIGMVSNTPFDFAAALVSRADVLRDVRVHHYLSAFPWADKAPPASIRAVTLFSTTVDRAALADGRAEYIPQGNWCAEHLARDHPPIDTAIVTLSPPDADGWMSFGSCLWLNRVFAGFARRVFAEIDESFIRTAGDNRIHISKIDRLWLRQSPPFARQAKPLDTEALAQSNAICRLVAAELIEDGDCVQIGLGDTSARLPYFMGHLRDIGIQTEVLPAGILDLIERGIVTGARKEIGTAKVVASAILAPPEEIGRAHMHPAVELWDFTRTDDIRLLTRLSNFKAINNAIEVDLGGQVTAETLGTRIYSRPGGQTAFAIAASYSPGGAAITVLPSSTVVGGVRRSRIVADLMPGAAVTVPRTHVDYVVTEFGIAKLSGATLSERARRLIAIAHPDFRDELTAAARRMVPSLRGTT